MTNHDNTPSANLFADDDALTARLDKIADRLDRMECAKIAGRKFDAQRYAALEDEFFALESDRAPLDDEVLKAPIADLSQIEQKGAVLRRVVELAEERAAGLIQQFADQLAAFALRSAA